MNQHYLARQHAFLSQFTCDAGRCLRDCCSRYSKIGVDPKILERFQAQAPELLQYVQRSGARSYMRNHEKRCCMFKDQRCEIQRRFGIHLLPEPCFTYPRRHLRLGDEVYITAHLCCSEAARLQLFAADPFRWEPVTLTRVPLQLRDPAFRDFNGPGVEDYLEIHQRIMGLMEEERFNSEEVLCRLLMLGRMLDSVPKTEWPARFGGILASLDSKVDALIERGLTGKRRQRLYDFLILLLAITNDDREEEFDQILQSVSQRALQEPNQPAFREIWRREFKDARADRVLKRYLQAKLSESLFPVITWGRCCTDMMLAACAYTCVRLAFVTHQQALGGCAAKEEMCEAVRIISGIEGGLWGKKNALVDYLRRVGWFDLESIAALLLAV